MKIGAYVRTNESRPLIAHVIYRLAVGGMENGLVNLINNLPSGRYRHAIICLTHSTDFANRITAENVDIYGLDKKKGKDPAHYLRYVKLLRRLQPAIVHTRNLGTLEMAPLAALAGVPVRIHGEHGWDSADLDGSRRKYKLLRKLCNPAVTRYVAVSRNITNWLIDTIGIEEQAVCQIYNGVDVVRFQPTGARADLPIGWSDAECLVIGTVGRMDPIKGLDILIAAVSKIVDSNTKLSKYLRLVMVGDGPILPELCESVETAGMTDNIWLAGKRDDIPELLRSMDVFVLPSLNEGISNTILESMATGLPIIASDVGGNGELIRGGQTGFLVPAKDTEKLAAAIQCYAENATLRKHHGMAARARAKEVFGLPLMVQQYARLYDSLLECRQ